jgi:hypothetical protein
VVERRVSRGTNAGNRGHGSKWLRPSTRVRIYERDGYRCVWCVRMVVEGRRRGADTSVRLASVDHVLPRCFGGSNEHRNLITSCVQCNSRRGDRSVLSFAADLAFDSLELEGATIEAITKRIFVATRASLPPRANDAA